MLRDKIYLDIQGLLLWKCEPQ